MWKIKYCVKTWRRRQKVSPSVQCRVKGPISQTVSRVWVWCMHFPRSLYRVVVLVRHGKEKQISVTIGVNIHLWLLELSDIGYKSSLKNWIVGFFCIFVFLNSFTRIPYQWFEYFEDNWGLQSTFGGLLHFFASKVPEICSSVLKQTRPKTLLTVIEVFKVPESFLLVCGSCLLFIEFAEEMIGNRFDLNFLRKSMKRFSNVCDF